MLLFISLTVFAVNLGDLTLHDAVMLAMRNNPTVKSQELDRVSAKFALAVAYHNFEPIFSLNGNASYSQTKANGVSSFSKSAGLTPSVSLNTASGAQYTVTMNNNAGAYYNPSLEVQVTQPLLRGFGENIVLNSLYTAIETEKLNRLGFRDTIESTIVTIVQNYTSILSAKRQLGIQERQLKESEQQVANVEKFIQAGQRSRTEKVTAESQVASGKLSVIQGINSVEEAKLTLLNSLGLSPDTKFNVPITDKIDIPKVKLPTLKNATDLALAYSTQYQTLLINQKQNERQLLIAEDNKRWQLNLTASATTGGGTGGGQNAGLESLVNGLNYGRTVSLQLSIPVDLITVEQQIINAKVSLETNLINIRQQKRTIENQLINDYRNIQVQKKQIELSKNNAELKEMVLQDDQKKYTYGRISQDQMNRDRTDLISAQLQVISNQVQLMNTLESFSQEIGTTLKRWKLTLRY